MRERAGFIAVAPYHFPVLQVSEYCGVVVDVAVEPAVHNRLHCCLGLVIASCIEHGAGLQGVGGVAVEPSRGICGLREMGYGVVEVRLDAVVAVRDTRPAVDPVVRVKGVYVEIEYHAEVVLYGCVRAHDEKVGIGPVVESLRPETPVVGLAEVRLVALKAVEELVYASNPSVACCPCVEVVVIDALLPIDGHNQVAVTGAGDDGSVFQDVRQPVGHARIAASEGVASELAEIGRHRIEGIEVEFDVLPVLEPIVDAVLVIRVDVKNRAGHGGER